MNIKKNKTKIILIFLFTHLFLWTIVPTLTNINLPLDTIEALAWGSNLDWGYSKHPPLSAFAANLFYQLFGNQDWSYYLLSQIFVVSSFYVIFIFSNKFLENKNNVIFSVILLEGIYFYNFTTPEFNVNIAQLPFWALSVFITWRCLKFNKVLDYIFLGITIGLGILSKYLFIYLAIGIALLFFYQLFKNTKIDIYKIIITVFFVLLILYPHFNWLFKNNFETIFYALKRSGGIGSLEDHFIFPITFILKQILILIPFFLMLFVLLKKIEFKKISLNQNLVFLFFVCIVPISLMILTSFIMGSKLRTMWMTPFYLFFGVLFIEVFKKQIYLKKLKKFLYLFSLFFLLSPAIYLSVSIIDDTKRTDYPGKEIARLVQNKWDDNFSNQIRIVIGDEWSAGNLSYHLYSRPRWYNDLKEKSLDINEEQGVIYTGNPKVLKQICPGVYGTIKPVGYCMIGKK